MCGIFGWVSASPVVPDFMVRAVDLIRHRGPDDEGYAFFAGHQAPVVCWGEDTPLQVVESHYAFTPEHALSTWQGLAEVALGHRRLAIVDVGPAGHQPMATSDSRYWVVFNGEIYNHVELRSELKALGYRFLTHSDTEVILAAYQAWGKNCLQRFNGMFAFLLYDAEQGRLFAARDRFGIKPLYYRVSADGIAFASEIKQFTVLPNWRAVINGQRAYDFLNWSISDHTDETMFAGVFQLRGGEAIELDIRGMSDGRGRPAAGGRLPVSRWYELCGLPFRGSMQDAAEQFRERFVDAVRVHLRADVPVGSCLSGGLDSSSIVCAMHDLLHQQDAHALQKTFSACADEKRFDERAWIEEVVRDTGVEAHFVCPAPDGLFDMHERIVWHQDEPFGSTSIYAQWQVFALAAQNNVKVMLDGQGADELLAGYHSFFGPRFAGLLRRGHWLRLWREMRQTKQIHGYSEWEAIKRTADMLLPEGIRHRARRLTGVTASVPPWIDLDRLGASETDPYVATGRKSDTVRAMSESMLTASNLQMLLHWEDRDSMAHSVESRVPFLDHRLVEFVLGLPDAYKFSDGVTKRVLREGMRGLLPERILTRMDKLGFVTPEETWLRERATMRFRTALDEAVSASQGVLNSHSIRVMEEMIAGRRPFSFTIWRMISFGAWMKQFEVMVER